MSRNGSPSLATWTVAALLLLAAQGLALRALASAPYSWTDRGDGRSLGTLPPQVEGAPPWSTVLEALRTHTATDRTLRLDAQEGMKRASAVRRAYTDLLAVLTPTQRADIQRPRETLVDPLFPGLNGDFRPLSDFCLAALASERSSPRASVTPSDPTDESEVPMPPVLIWGITRLALVEGPHPLSNAQRSALVAGIDTTIHHISDYHHARATLAYHLGLPALTSVQPLIAWPAAQELRDVRDGLQGWARHR